MHAEHPESVGVIIEYSLDGGHVWHHGRTLAGWIAEPAYADALRKQRQIVRDSARQEHGDVDRIITRVLREDDERAEVNRPRS
ncbi:hypothetical protein MF672_038880 [Actinomadura sp. ATCC 31491]|uniref:Uncharacterized protein n=1 Tax=Actinomadura luzonensis TaxID=2805427 RepID=A0ABT0G5D2_9ACTN|nr:hypothetical protein [Actinomadura luzonensis]MCK2219719.1 hypothetical protein [Actinomadura luzonensis]